MVPIVSTSNCCLVVNVCNRKLLLLFTILLFYSTINCQPITKINKNRNDSWLMTWTSEWQVRFSICVWNLTSLSELENRTTASVFHYYYFHHHITLLSSFIFHLSFKPQALTALLIPWPRPFVALRAAKTWKGLKGSLRSPNSQFSNAYLQMHRSKQNCSYCWKEAALSAVSNIWQLQAESLVLSGTVTLPEVKTVSDRWPLQSWLQFAHWTLFAWKPLGPWHTHQWARVAPTKEANMRESKWV